MGTPWGIKIPLSPELSARGGYCKGSGAVRWALLLNHIHTSAHELSQGLALEHIVRQEG